MKVTLSEDGRSASQLLTTREICVAVATIPRSGSSLMTRILSALTVNMIQTTDEPEAKRLIDARQRRRYGDGYHMNPGGFGEVAERKLYHQLRWLAEPWSGIKVIYPLNPVALELLTLRPCRVIQMVRDPVAISASHMAAFGDDPDRRIPEPDIFKTYQEGFAAQMREEQVACLPVSYDELVDHPIRVVTKVAAFINAPRINIATAAREVDPSQRRFS